MTLRYNGRQTEDPRPFLPEMDEACEIIEKIVNAELKKRKRFPLEWGGHDGDDGLTWRANVAASNCYRGSKEGVGPHTDQLTYLGPYPTIASLSLGTPPLCASVRGSQSLPSLQEHQGYSDSEKLSPPQKRTPEPHKRSTSH